MADLPTASTWFPTVEGLPGKSAYEIAVDEGFLGSEAQWLATLVGPIGATGPQGIQGIQGPAGQSVTVQDEGISLTTAATLINFAGAGVTVTEPVADQLLVTIPGGGGGGSAGIAANWPSGAVYFPNYVAPWADGVVQAVDITRMWVFTVDSDATFTGIQYGVGVADATAEVWFEVHRILGSGLPGSLVASVQLNVTAVANGLVASFASPTLFTAGMYFFSTSRVVTGGGAVNLDSIAPSSTESNPREFALYVTDYWSLLSGTAERFAVDFNKSHLPGGVFTPGSDWTGTSLQVADTTAATTIPLIGLIKQ